MEILAFVLIITQLLFMLVAGIYFYENIKGQKPSKGTTGFESDKEMEKLKKMRKISLSEPLSEKTRPQKLEDIVGQEEGVKVLRAIFCGKNPQHVIIYGPPGIGKTAAARLILEEAKKTKDSPFNSYSKFIEIDATTLRFDERSIADPLIGSVHDPIYQGAGAYGSAGIPQPKEGAVTKSHGGVLFIDEIGELHPMQLNKLLKVLEDRKVFLTSSYYNPDNRKIPKYIHDMFKNGLPADFRLVGATTRSPEELPPALRSRCSEIFFDGLKVEHIKKIGESACKRAGYNYSDSAIEKITKFATSGRETVNIVQMASSVANMEKRENITLSDVEWVLETGRYVAKQNKKIGRTPNIGVVNGLAVYGGDKGTLLEIEVFAKPVKIQGAGSIKITGIVEVEEIKNGSNTLKRRSNAKSSAEIVLTVIEEICKVNIKDYDIHINFPGGMPVDGPSAGIAMLSGVYSAISGKVISNKIAMTGEVSIQGSVMPVGGVRQKIIAAKEAGADKVLIPADNYQESYKSLGVELVCVSKTEDVIFEVFGRQTLEIKEKVGTNNTTGSMDILTAHQEIV